MVATSSLAVSFSNTAERSGVVPMPGVAKLYFFGLLCTSLISSGMDFAGTEGWATKTFGEAAMFETGAKLRYGS